MTISEFDLNPATISSTVKEGNVGSSENHIPCLLSCCALSPGVELLSGRACFDQILADGQGRSSRMPGSCTSLAMWHLLASCTPFPTPSCGTVGVSPGCVWIQPRVQCALHIAVKGPGPYGADTVGFCVRVFLSASFMSFRKSQG